MRFRLQPLKLAVAAVMLGGLIAQPQNGGKAPTLELIMRPDAPRHGIPLAFSFVLVNKSSHDVRVPQPSINCDDSYNGEVLLNVRLKACQGRVAER